MYDDLIPGCPLPDPDTIRIRISELDAQAATLRRLLRLVIRIRTDAQVTNTRAEARHAG